MQSIGNILACLALCFTTTAARTQILVDNDLQQALEGAWCNSIDQGKTCWGFDIFEKGQTRYCGRLPETGEVVYGSTKYFVKGNRVCHTITSSNTDDVLEVGEEFCFDVLSVDAERQVFRSVETRDLDTLYRTSISSVVCPKAGI